MTYILMCLKKDIETEKLKPLVINGLVPLCSAQYDKLFGTTRLPGQERGGYGLVWGEWVDDWGGWVVGD